MISLKFRHLLSVRNKTKTGKAAAQSQTQSIVTSSIIILDTVYLCDRQTDRQNCGSKKSLAAASSISVSFNRRLTRRIESLYTALPANHGLSVTDRSVWDYWSSCPQGRLQATLKRRFCLHCIPMCTSHIEVLRHLRVLYHLDVCVMTIDDMIDHSDYELFTKVCSGSHSLHHLLPSYRTSDLCLRGHPFQLPDYYTDLHKKSFVVRSLYAYIK